VEFSRSAIALFRHSQPLVPSSQSSVPNYLPAGGFDIKQRAFGNSGVNVSEIGLGCWQLGGADWGDMSEEDALATLQAALESGVNFFDTADVYGLGRSESIIGKFLKDCPEEVHKFIGELKLACPCIPSFFTGLPGMPFIKINKNLGLSAIAYSRAADSYFLRLRDHVAKIC